MELLSVVIPVYNTEKYLPRCIESLLGQTYKNTELIFVNDCSPGNAEEIIKGYAKSDSRVKYVTYDKNRGLFRARLAGAEAASGSFIAFLDSDDFVSEDFYRTLVLSLEKNNTDIAVGKTVFRAADGYCYVRIMHDECFNFDVIRGDEVRERYFSQKGQCFSWHTVWNKVYRKSLWDKCMPFYRRISSHLIMTEDIAFSSLLFYYAQGVSTAENDAVFYCENENASTDASKTDLKRFTKNMADIKLVFDFVSGFLDEAGAEERIKAYFYETKKYYCRMWRDLSDATFKGEELKAANAVLEDFVPGYTENTSQDDRFFASLAVKWNNGLESIKTAIINSKARYISFDIFDTLITRKLYYPDDVFLLLNKRFEELVKTNIGFERIRKGAEARAREKAWAEDSSCQDITLDEIYSAMAEYYDIPLPAAEEMKKAEIEAELSLTVQRRAAKELFDTAIASGKEVILVSDMYLTEDVIEKMLKKAGYSGYKRLFLSSSYRLTKHSGDLFKAVIRELGANGEDILHIGDTWNNDIEKPKQLGIETVFFPKAAEVFENRINGCTVNHCADLGASVSGAVCDSRRFMDSLGYRTMRALAAIKYFDNPYRSFDSESDFNADPYYIGYNALGMHLVGIVKWLADNNGKKLFFLARDGYLPMKAYEIMSKALDLPECSYISASRRMLLPEMIESRLDFYDLPVEYRNHTPSTLMELLDFCTRDGAVLSDDDRPFADEREYRAFIDRFISDAYDEDKHRAARAACEKYFEPLSDSGTAAFDMGYSGRIQTALSRAAGRGADVYFIHSDGRRSADMSRKGGYGIHSFYDFYPCVSGLLREHIFSDTEPSAIGIRMEDGRAVPVYDDTEKGFQDIFTVKNMQRGALDLVRDFTELYAEYGQYLAFKPYEASMMFEGYLRAAADRDRRIFASSYFEDKVYGSNRSINIYEFVKNSLFALPADNGQANIQNRWDIIEAAVRGHGRLVRAICYMLLDRRLFKQYIIDILARRPKLLKTLVRIKHIFTGSKNI